MSSEGHRQRGIHLQDFILQRNWMYPTPTGPTRYAVNVSPNGTRERANDGTINDHILVGSDVFAHIREADTEAQVLSGVWGSDHEPLAWCASLGIARQTTRDWCRKIAWHLITDAHRERFNVVFGDIIKRERRARRWTMFAVENAITTASRVSLP